MFCAISSNIDHYRILVSLSLDPKKKIPRSMPARWSVSISSTETINRFEKYVIANMVCPIVMTNWS